MFFVDKNFFLRLKKEKFFKTLMRKIVILTPVFFIFFVYGCSKDKLTDSNVLSKQEIEKILGSGVVSPTDLDTLNELSKKYISNTDKSNKSFVILANSNIGSNSNSNSNSSYSDLLKKIKDNGGEIIFTDSRLGYIHFKYPSHHALNLLYSELNNLKSIFIDKELADKPFKVNENDRRKFENDKNNNKSSKNNKDAKSFSIRNNIYSDEMMRVPELKKYFKEKYNQELDGSNVTIVVVDTGLDIARTDAFQGRIVGLRSLRNVDNALIAKAEVKDIDGKKYLWAKINGIEVKILKSERLSQERQYFIGYFTEKQFSVLDKDHKNYDFNQDGKDNAIYPIVVFKNNTNSNDENNTNNINSGIFEAYVNTNSTLTYKEKGDDSIEDENRLLDFNFVSKASTALAEDRYVKNSKYPALSFYRYTTRLDIIDLERSDINTGDIRLFDDRNKGVMNIGITIAAGFELDDRGEEFVKVAESAEGQELYRVGLVGYDTHGHGTFCAGLAAGNFDTASEFRSGAFNAKIVGISLLGGNGRRVGDYVDSILKIIHTYPNVIFSFSFGNNDANNDTQSDMSKLHDEIARTYQTVFVKSAGNEGPGVKSHGTTVANHVISVASYYSTNSRETHGEGNFQNDKMFIENSSSRGPTVDGALKPDIGAPGWTVGVRTFSRSLESDSKKGSFQYWSGTSMAAPNLASVVALLYDGAVKAKLINNDLINIKDGVEGGYNSIPYPPITVDKVFTSLRNSAIAYDPQVLGVSSGVGAGMNIAATIDKPAWIEGGAGRVNALGAFEIIEKIYNKPPRLYATETASNINGYNSSVAVGYFAINKLPQYIDFFIRFDHKIDLSHSTDHESFVLKIPEDIDWLSFDKKQEMKERYIDIFAAEKTYVRLYVRTEKLTQNNRLKGGLHTAVVKAFNVSDVRASDSIISNVYDFVFPITLIGYDTLYDSQIDKDHFSRRGFIPVGHFARFFLPIIKDQDALLADLTVTDSNPGDVSMAVYHRGMEIPFSEFQAPTMWALNSSTYGEGRNRLRYIFSDRPTGLYEIVLRPDTSAAYNFNGVDGSYYDLQASRFTLTIPKTYIITDGEFSEVVLENAKNTGSYLRVASANVAITSLRHKETIKIKDKEIIKIPITTHLLASELLINTKYLGNIEKMDIDLHLLDEHSGEEVAADGSPSADETIRFSLGNLINIGHDDGRYILVIDAYSIPSESKEANFLLTIKQNLRNPLVLVDSFFGPTKDVVLKNNFRWEQDREYTFKAKLNSSRSALEVMPQLDKYEQVMSTTIRAMSGNSGDSVLIFNRELN